MRRSKLERKYKFCEEIHVCLVTGVHRHVKWRVDDNHMRCPWSVWSAGYKIQYIVHPYTKRGLRSGSRIRMRIWDRILSEEEEYVRYLTSKLRDDTVLNSKPLFVSVSKTINNGSKIIRTVLDWEYCWVLTLKHMRNMGAQAEACGYGLRETDNTKSILLL